MTHTDKTLIDQIDDIEHDEFLKRVVIVMAGLGYPGEAISILPELLENDFSEDDKERILEIMDEIVDELRQLKAKCIRIKNIDLKINEE